METERRKTLEKNLCIFLGKKKSLMEAYAIKGVAAGAHLPTPWLFERPDGRADYCLDCSFL